MTVPAPDLRDRLRRALAEAGGWDFDRLEPHDFQDEADRLLAIVQPELDQWAADCQKYTDLACGAESARQIHKADADQYEEQLRGERDRYRSAWLSARQRAEAYGEGTLRHVEDRDTWKGWMRQQEARAIAAEQQLAAVRAYADDLYTAPPKVSACGVRERLLDILTPTGPARTIAEAMAGRPAPACGDQLTDWTCTLPPGPHPDWRHGNGEHWWTQTRCPGDCGQPNIEHHCTKET